MQNGYIQKVKKGFIFEKGNLHDTKPLTLEVYDNKKLNFFC